MRPTGLFAFTVLIALTHASCGSTPTQHRASPITCGQHLSGVACTADADCVSGGLTTPCVHGSGGSFCTFDQCLDDTGCAATEACSCAEDSSTFGLVFSRPGNGCLPASCHVDADCGDTPFCSPTISHYCGSRVTGFRCHTSSDTCSDDRDCSQAQGSSTCDYHAETGSWSCGLVTACHG